MKRSFIITPAASSNVLGLVVNGVDVLETAVSAAQTLATSTSVTLALSSAISKAAILDAATIAIADVAGVTMAITEGGSAISQIGFGANTVAGQNSESTTGAYMMTTASDTLKIAIDGLSVTISGTQLSMGSGGYTAANIATLIENIEQQWKNNYVLTTATVKSAANVKWEITSVSDAFGAALTSPTRTIKFLAKDHGTPAIGITPVVTITKGKTATGTNLGYIIGNGTSVTNSSGDDGSKGVDLVLSITADTGGSTLSEIGLPLAAGSLAAKGLTLTYTGTSSELNSTYKPNSTASASVIPTNAWVHESRTDVVIGEELNAAAATNAVDFTRVGWL
tara:strand:+ start:508 stop:1518 length:1011 start_codon:yes stop_codon:yes gene_type:complete